jgi:hypothetical protein
MLMRATRRPAPGGATMAAHRGPGVPGPSRRGYTRAAPVPRRSVPAPGRLGRPAAIPGEAPRGSGGGDPVWPTAPDPPGRRSARPRGKVFRRRDSWHQARRSAPPPPSYGARRSVARATPRPRSVSSQPLRAQRKAARPATPPGAAGARPGPGSEVIRQVPRAHAGRSPPSERPTSIGCHPGPGPGDGGAGRRGGADRGGSAGPPTVAPAGSRTRTSSGTRETGPRQRTGWTWPDAPRGRRGCSLVISAAAPRLGLLAGVLVTGSWPEPGSRVVERPDGWVVRPWPVVDAPVAPVSGGRRAERGQRMGGADLMGPWPPGGDIRRVAPPGPRTRPAATIDPGTSPSRLRSRPIPADGTPAPPAMPTLMLESLTPSAACLLAILVAARRTAARRLS